jgi:hypothetical protein
MFKGVPELAKTKPPDPVPDTQSPIAELDESVPSILNPPLGELTGAIPGPI